MDQNLYYITINIDILSTELSKATEIFIKNIIDTLNIDL